MLSLSLSLSLWLAGASAFPVPMAMDVTDPWQDSAISAVEAVEPCPSPLLFQQSWCVYVWVHQAEMVVLVCGGVSFVE